MSYSRTQRDSLPRPLLAVLIMILLALASGCGNKVSSTTGTASGGDDQSGVEKGTSRLLPAHLPAATASNFDVVAARYNPETAPVKPGPKTFNLTTEEQRVKLGNQVATLWTFNKTAPGPVLRAVVGDKITVNLTNNMKSKMFHSVDFHASRMSLGGGDVQVAPGKTGTFTFTAEYPGLFMYHCATAPVLLHIGSGMYGMLIVQPKEGFGPKMREFAVVQSELYRDFTDMQAGHESNVVMNGIPHQYVDAPIKLPADANVRLFYLDAGPSKVASFHVVGTVFDRVLSDGNPRNATYGRQAVAVPVSGGGVFEFKLVGEGKFPFLTHAFHDVDSGAVGIFQTGDGDRLGNGSPMMAH